MDLGFIRLILNPKDVMVFIEQAKSWRLSTTGRTLPPEHEKILKDCTTLKTPELIKGDEYNDIVQILLRHGSGTVYTKLPNKDWKHNNEWLDERARKRTLGYRALQASAENVNLPTINTIRRCFAVENTEDFSFFESAFCEVHSDLKSRCFNQWIKTKKLPTVSLYGEEYAFSKVCFLSIDGYKPFAVFMGYVWSQKQGCNVYRYMIIPSSHMDYSRLVRYCEDRFCQAGEKRTLLAG